MSQSGGCEHHARVSELIATLKQVLVELDALNLSPDVGAHLDWAIVRLEQIANCGSNPT